MRTRQWFKDLTSVLSEILHMCSDALLKISEHTSVFWLVHHANKCDINHIPKAHASYLGPRRTKGAYDERKNMPTSRKVLSTFETYSPVGVQVCQTLRCIVAHSSCETAQKCSQSWLLQSLLYWQSLCACTHSSPK